MRTCDNCGATMYGSKCKVMCPVCGTREDCSDAGLPDWDQFASIIATHSPALTDEESTTIRLIESIREACQELVQRNLSSAKVDQAIRALQADTDVQKIIIRA